MRMINYRVKSKFTGREETISIPWDWLSDKEQQRIEAQELSDYDEKMTQEAQHGTDEDVKSE